MPSPEFGAGPIPAAFSDCGSSSGNPLPLEIPSPELGAGPGLFAAIAMQLKLIIKKAAIKLT